MKPRATLAWWLLFVGLVVLATSRRARAVGGAGQTDKCSVP
jgi:hypothetical protein